MGRGRVLAMAIFLAATVPCQAEPAAPEAVLSRAGVQAVVAGCNDFAFDLYARLGAAEGGNLFFSPASVETALAMTYAGARGRTAEQMAKTLRFPAGPEHVSEPFGALTAALNEPRLGPGNEPAYRLAVANALWAQEGYAFRVEYVRTIESRYGASLGRLDFRAEPESARRRINDWVAARTADRIKDLIPPGVIRPATRLVLTNAVYFKSSWADPFEKAATSDGDFRVSAARTVRVPLMRQEGRFGYFETDSLQLLEMPYRSGDLSMIVLLPRDAEGLEALETRLTGRNVAAWLEGSTRRKVRVALPRFEVTSRFDLGQTLAAMGMPDAFDPGRADFGGMAAEKLFVSAVLHKAFVAVDEEGTEAAAATAVAMMLTSAPPPEDPKTFLADHPFVFLIRHNPTGTILFLGRVTNPSA